MKNMRKLITFLAFAFILAFGNNLIAQTSYQDVVYLKNGSVVKGIIIEQTLNVNLKLKTSDGSLFVFEMKDVEKITKEAVGVNRNDKTQSNIDDSYPIKTTAKNFRDPTVSTVLSFLIPGVGQFYNGQTGKGVGYLLWNIGSYGLMYASILSMYKMDYNGNYYIKENSSNWAMVGLISGFSGIACWIVSMIDANNSSKAINRQLGFASIQLGERTNLSFNPDIKLVNNYSSINSNSISPTYGLNIRLSF